MDLVLSTNFPVVKLKLTMVRDPRSVLQSVFIPACTQASLAMVAAGAETDSERLFLISVPLVALGKIKEMLVDELPSLDGTTVAELFIL